MSAEIDTTTEAVSIDAVMNKLQHWRDDKVHGRLHNMGSQQIG